MMSNIASLNSVNKNLAFQKSWKLSLTYVIKTDNCKFMALITWKLIKKKLNISQWTEYIREVNMNWFAPLKMVDVQNYNKLRFLILTYKMVTITSICYSLLFDRSHKTFQFQEEGKL